MSAKCKLMSGVSGCVSTRSTAYMREAEQNRVFIQAWGRIHSNAALGLGIIETTINTKQERQGPQQKHIKQVVMASFDLPLVRIHRITAFAFDG